MSDHIAQFRDAITAAGLPAPDKIVDDGKMHRFSTNGSAKDQDGFYALHPDGIPAGTFGCWRTDMKANWSAKADNTMTPEEREAHRRRVRPYRRGAMQRQPRRRKFAGMALSELPSTTTCAPRV
jgi:putative DNA primase/helicase